MDALSDLDSDFIATESVDASNKTYSSDSKISNYANPSTNEGENSSTNEAVDLSPNKAEHLSPDEAGYLSPNEAEGLSPNEAVDLSTNKAEDLSPDEADDSNLDRCKVSDDTSARHQPIQFLNCDEESIRICKGNSDKMFLPLVEKRKGVFKNVSGQP